MNSSGRRGRTRGVTSATTGVSGTFETSQKKKAARRPSITKTKKVLFQIGERRMLLKGVTLNGLKKEEESQSFKLPELFVQFAGGGELTRLGDNQGRL